MKKSININKGDNFIPDGIGIFSVDIGMKVKRIIASPHTASLILNPI